METEMQSLAYHEAAERLSDRELLEAMFVNSCEARDTVAMIMAKFSEVMESVVDNPMLGMLLGGNGKKRK